MVFTLKNKSGFVCSEPNVIINDDKGNIFYFKVNNHGSLHFNLPSGTYSTSNKLYLAPLRKYKLMKLPKPNRPMPYPKTPFKIYFIDNPNKCSVDKVKHEIYFDNSFKGAPKFVFDFIIYHELGHYDYSGQGQLSENNCDAFAFNEMIKDGYNPSQISSAINYSLSDRKKSNKRKTKIYLHAKKSFL